MFIKKAMGCAQSKEAPARVLPPKPTVSLSSCVACDEDNAFPTPGAFASEDKGGDAFSLHAMRMADFLALERLLPHNELVAKGLVAALDFEGEHRGVSLNFVSHQWLAYASPDPDAVQYSALLEACDALCSEKGLAADQLYLWIDVRAEARTPYPHGRC